MQTGSLGTKVLDNPFTPSITGVAAPASWLPALAGSWRKSTGRPVHTTSPSPKSESFGFGTLVVDDAEKPRLIIYTGVERVAADFEVHCNPTVRGTFLGWSVTVVGAVACQYQPDTEYDAFGRLALEHCPDPLTPPPSQPVAGVPLPSHFGLTK